LTFFSAEGFTHILIFAEPDAEASGTFSILSAILSYVVPIGDVNLSSVIYDHNMWLNKP